MMSKSLCISIALLFLLQFGMTTSAIAQNTVNWMTWEEAVEKSKTEPRKIFVDVYTDWCNWCKKMDESTFADPIIANYINNHFYPVKFNAEQTDPIKFNGKEYKYVKSGKRGYHELAAWMMKGRIGYPTMVFIDTNLEIIQPIPGFAPSEKFEPIMTYFGEDHHRKTPWEIYQKKYEENMPYKNDRVPTSNK